VCILAAKRRAVPDRNLRKGKQHSSNFRMVGGSSGFLTRILAGSYRLLTPIAACVLVFLMSTSLPIWERERVEGHACPLSGPY
jgi:hypothetical protein